MTNASDLISQDRKAKIEMSFLSKILFYHISVHNTVKIIYNLIWLTSHYIIDYIIALKGIQTLSFADKSCNILESMGSNIKPSTYTCQAKHRLWLKCKKSL